MREAVSHQRARQDGSQHIQDGDKHGVAQVQQEGNLGDRIHVVHQADRIWDPLDGQRQHFVEGFQRG